MACSVGKAENLIEINLVLRNHFATLLKDPLNVVDFAAIVPFYVSILLEGLEDYEIIGKTGKIIRLVRVMRVLRLAKNEKILKYKNTS